MSELAVRSPNGRAVDIQPTQDQAIVRLAEWARAADAAYHVAAKLCGTQFAPTAYRGKPEEATAAILAGAEVGLSPMASLRAFDNIQGTPAPKAITLRAIVQASGHEIRIDESSAERAVVSARRKGDTEWQTCTWTVQRAQQAGFPAKNPNWKSNPTAMLVARATAEVCRWIASDAIMGMPYSAEEIRDEGDAFEPRPAPRRVTAAEIVGGMPDQPAEVAATEPVSAPPAASTPRMPTDAQLAKMFALFKDAYITDRDGQLGYIAEVIGRTVESRKELTAADVHTVIDSLDRYIAQNTPPADAAPDGAA